MSEIPDELLEQAYEALMVIQLSDTVRGPLASVVASAMLFERERCAKIAEQVAVDRAVDDGEPWVCHVIAKAIRGEA